MGKWTYRIADELFASGHSVELWFADRFARLAGLGRANIALLPCALGIEMARARTRFDIAVVHEPSGLGYAALRKMAPGLPPMIAMCHNVESHVARTMRMAARHGWTDFRWRGFIAQELWRRPWSDGAVVLADHVICLSSSDRRYLTRRLRVAADRVSLMVNGVGPEYFDTPATAEQRSNILFVGGWLDIKGRRVLPPLWEQVAIRHPGLGLTVVGSGVPEAVVLADFPPAVRSRVNVVSKVSNDTEMAALYRSHQAFLMPSLTEGSPLSLLEAMACELPVVASAVGGIPDIITHQTTGLLFPQGNIQAGASALSGILSDSALASRLGSAARGHVEKLNWQSAASVLQEAATALVARGCR